MYTTNTDNGPAIPIIWDRGSNIELGNLLASHVRDNHVDLGYVQVKIAWEYLSLSVKFVP